MKVNTIPVFCENTCATYSIPPGSSLKEFKEIVFPGDNDDVLGALVNNEVQDLHYEVYKPKSIRFVTLSSRDGYSMYIRTIIFVLYKAIKTLFPRDRLVVEHFISNGVFCRVGRGAITNTGKIARVKEKMRDIVNANIEILREETLTVEAISLFNREGLHDKEDLLATRGKIYTSVYVIDGTPDYFYGTLAPRTGCVRVFDLLPYKDGLLLLLADSERPGKTLPFIPREKLFRLLDEDNSNGLRTRTATIGDLNRNVEAGNAGEIIKISEAMHEKKISRVADMITRLRGIKVVLIAGPSSSGKTTFGKRLAVQLMVNGTRPVNLSIDNYFVNRDETPRDEKGEFDFETIDAVDIDAFNDDLVRLAAGEEVEIPKFSFETGCRYRDGERLKLPRRGVIIVEGIHGLNPRLTRDMPREMLFKVFISALTSISIDHHNIINPTDNRMIRRMVRDHKYRGYSALETIRRWDSVLAGEQRHIVPYQEEADVFFNSALAYELGALKQAAVPLLEEVREKHAEHSKALRLLKFFSYVRAIPLDEVPPTSIIREFLGGSSFKY